MDICSLESRQVWDFYQQEALMSLLLWLEVKLLAYK